MTTTITTIDPLAPAEASPIAGGQSRSSSCGARLDVTDRVVPESTDSPIQCAAGRRASGRRASHHHFCCRVDDLVSQRPLPVTTPLGGEAGSRRDPLSNSLGTSPGRPVDFLARLLRVSPGRAGSLSAASWAMPWAEAVPTQQTVCSRSSRPNRCNR